MEKRSFHGGMRKTITGRSALESRLLPFVRGIGVGSISAPVLLVGRNVLCKRKREETRPPLCFGTVQKDRADSENPDDIYTTSTGRMYAQWAYSAAGASTGHTLAQEPQSRHRSGSITYLPSFSEMASTGHSEAQEPQPMQSSEILYAMIQHLHL